MELEMERLWAKKLQVFAPTPFNRNGAIVGILRIAFKALYEYMREETFAKFGLQQIQVDCAFLGEVVRDFVEAGAKEACAKETVNSPIGPEVTAGRHTLCTMTTGVDAAVGQFVAMLQAKGMWEDTVLWVTTDNGGMTSGPKADGAGVWSASSNFPLRGGKTTLFEGGVRGTSFVAGGFLPAAARGKVVRDLMMHVDVPATMARLGGADWGRPVDGVDAWGAIVAGAPSGRTEVPVNVDTCVGFSGGPPCGRSRKFNALIDGRWKLIEANWQIPVCPNTTWCTGAGMYDGWWTNDPYTHIAPDPTSQGAMPSSDLRGGGIWLFDLSDDPNEKMNLAARNPDIVKRMRARLAFLADKRNGYRTPQLNFPNLRSLPALHNGTWEPFRRVGEDDEGDASTAASEGTDLGVAGDGDAMAAELFRDHPLFL